MTRLPDKCDTTAPYPRAPRGAAGLVMRTRGGDDVLLDCAMPRIGRARTAVRKNRATVVRRCFAGPGQPKSGNGRVCFKHPPRCFDAQFVPGILCVRAYGGGLIAVRPRTGWEASSLHHFLVDASGWRRRTA